MNTPLLNKLREHLASISKEQFAKDWAEIQAMGFDGPTMEEFIYSISCGVAISEVQNFETISSKYDLQNSVVTESGTDYSAAA